MGGTPHEAPPLSLYSLVPRPIMCKFSRFAYGLRPPRTIIWLLLSRAPSEIPLPRVARLFYCLRPGPMLQDVSYVHQDHKPASAVHKKLNTRRCEHPLAGVPGLSGWGDGDFHPGVNFSSTEQCGVWAKERAEAAMPRPLVPSPVCLADSLILLSSTPGRSGRRTRCSLLYVQGLHSQCRHLDVPRTCLCDGGATFEGDGLG